MAAHTLRSLAKLLKYSRSTISDALRHSPNVNAKTAERIRQAAAAAGYRSNPLASAVMSEIRRSHNAAFRGMLASVLLEERDRPPVFKRFFTELIAGASDRAAELGFGLEKFEAGGRTMPLKRLDGILKARGIRGLILMPAWGTPDFTALDWSHYAAVYCDYIVQRPPLHAVSTAHYRSLMGVLERLHARGYRRPGIFLTSHRDERLQHSFESAFLGFQQHAKGLTRVPPLVVPEITPALFSAWFRQHQPDVVLGHHTQALEWMKACGAKIPQTNGFFCLNLFTETTTCAGLDLQPRLWGTQAAELVIAQLHRNQHGIPPSCSMTTIPARWVEAPTIIPSGHGPEPEGPLE